MARVPILFVKEINLLAPNEKNLEKVKDNEQSLAHPVKLFSSCCRAKHLLIKNTNIGFLSWPRKWCYQKNCLVDLKLTAAEKEVEGISIFRHFLSVREINVNLQLTKYCRLKTVVKAFFAWSSYCLRHFNQLFAIILLGVAHFFLFVLF